MRRRGSRQLLGGRSGNRVLPRRASPHFVASSCACLLGYCCSSVPPRSPLSHNHAPPLPCTCCRDTHAILTPGKMLCWCPALIHCLLQHSYKT
jgi:hypothetical protein